MQNNCRDVPHGTSLNIIIIPTSHIPIRHATWHVSTKKTKNNNTKNNTKMKKNSILIILLSIFMFVIYTGCNKDQELGLDVLPDDDLLNATISDTFAIEVYTTKSEHLVTSTATTLLLGSYIDPVFGGIKSSFATQIMQTSYPVPSLDSAITVLESLELYLPLKEDDRYFGHFTTPQEIFVYRISEILRTDTTYYSDENPNNFHQGELIGQQTITPGGGDTVLIVTLSEELANDFIYKADYYFRSLEVYFYDIFKGIYVTTGNEINDIAIYKIDLTSPEFRMQLNYHTKSNTDTTYKYKLPGSTYAARFSVFEHDHTNATFYDQITSPFTIKDSLAYIQAMGGTKVRLAFPTLSKLNEADNVVVNKAELVIKTDENQTNETSSLALVGYTNNDEIVFFEDFYNSSSGSYDGASYNEEAGEYRFNITRMVQGMIDNETQDFEFYLVDKAASYDYSSTVITTASHSNKMKLVVTYTEYK